MLTTTITTANCIMTLFTRHGGGDDDGDGAMAMGSSMGMGSSSHSMPSMNGFHAGAGDTLWISGFTPTSSAAVFGACVLLFFIAILMRFCEGLHRSCTLHWAERATTEHDERLAHQTSTSKVPFLAASEVSRGVLVMIQAGLMYLAMLAVMTYNVYYFVSLLIGVFVGEMLFGRFGRPHLSSANATHRLPRRVNAADSQDEIEPLTSLHIQPHEHTKQY